MATLHSAPTGQYFAVDPSAVPEAMAEFYEDAYLKKERLTQPNYGCKAVQREFALTGHQILLHRPAIAKVLDLAQSGRKPQISLEGWTGSGKSVALFSLVAWARANGWITLYVPSAFSMVKGEKFFGGEGLAGQRWLWSVDLGGGASIGRRCTGMMLARDCAA